MKGILRYVGQYWHATNKWYLLAVSVFTALLICCNYTFDVEYRLARYTGLKRWSAFTALYTLSYGLPFLLHQIICRERLENTTPKPYSTIYCFVLACAGLFSFKASSTVILEQLRSYFQTFHNNYWAIIINTPVKLLLVWVGMHFLWRLLKPGGAYMGLQLPPKRDVRNYLYMFLIMVPIVMIAASLPSFLTYYPKFKSIVAPHVAGGWWKIILYELSYACDFITIELFFRGLLVAGLIKIAGPMAIIPMAAFYCAIHFGKPLGECISSYFGGLFLGILTWRTNSIAGGLVLHIGIAWLMELTGFVFGML